MGAGWSPKQGDTAPPIAVQLRQDPLWGARTGDPVDLTGATQVAMVFQHEPTKTIVHAIVATVTDAVNGRIETPLAAEITAKPGLVTFETEVTWADGSTTTYPSTPNQPRNSINVRRELTMPDSIPVPPAGPDEEVGEGATLPADGSTWELFRLEGNANLPDGLYRWSEASNVWIQE